MKLILCLFVLFSFFLKSYAKADAIPPYSVETTDYKAILNYVQIHLHEAFGRDDSIQFLRRDVRPRTYILETVNSEKQSCQVQMIFQNSTPFELAVPTFQSITGEGCSATMLKIKAHIERN